MKLWIGNGRALHHARIAVVMLASTSSGFACVCANGTCGASFSGDAPARSPGGSAGFISSWRWRFVPRRNSRSKRTTGLIPPARGSAAACSPLVPLAVPQKAIAFTRFRSRRVECYRCRFGPSPPVLPHTALVTEVGHLNGVDEPEERRRRRRVSRACVHLTPPHRPGLIGVLRQSGRRSTTSRAFTNERVGDVTRPRSCGLARSEFVLARARSTVETQRPAARGAEGAWSRFASKAFIDVRRRAGRDCSFRSGLLPGRRPSRSVSGMHYLGTPCCRSYDAQINVITMAIADAAIYWPLVKHHRHPRERSGCRLVMAIASAGREPSSS
jgi:hypothetical protein